MELNIREIVEDSEEDVLKDYGLCKDMKKETRKWIFYDIYPIQFGYIYT